MPTADPHQTIVFDVTAATASHLTISFELRRPQSSLVSGEITFDSKAGLPQTASIVEGDDAFAQANLFADPWTLWRYFVSTEFGPSYYMFSAPLRAPLLPLLSFLAWNRSLESDRPATQDPSGLTSIIEATEVGHRQLLKVKISVPSFHRIGEPWRLEPHDFYFEEGSWFPSSIPEIGMSCVNDRDGEHRIPWASTAAFRTSERCREPSMKVDRWPVEGRRSIAEFPFSTALAEVKATSTWGAYADAHEDWYIFGARFREEIDVGAVTAGSPQWDIELGRPNPLNPIVEGARIYSISRANEFSPAIIVSDAAAILPPLPPIETVRRNATTMADVFYKLRELFPGDRLEISSHMQTTGFEMATVQTNGFAFVGEDSPIEFHFGTGGCFLRTARFVPETF